MSLKVGSDGAFCYQFATNFYQWVMGWLWGISPMTSSMPCWVKTVSRWP